MWRQRFERTSNLEVLLNIALQKDDSTWLANLSGIENLAYGVFRYKIIFFKNIKEQGSSIQHYEKPVEKFSVSLSFLNKPVQGWILHNEISLGNC